MRRTVLTALAILVAACAAHRPKADSQHPADRRTPPAASNGASRTPGAVPERTDTPASAVACGTPPPERVCLPSGLSQIGHVGDESHFAERPARAARLSAFEIDRNEVSAAAYAECVSRERCRAASCDDGSSPASSGPARCIAWADARAYCASVGGRLPTEAEWERAAAGVLPGHRQHPWGASASDAGVIDVTPEGIRDLGGGVAEWVEDAGAFYLLPPRADAGVTTDAGAAESAEREFRDAGSEFTDGGLAVVDDPRGPRDSPWRVVRGGRDDEPITSWTSSRRTFRRPTERRPWIGFRCVYPPTGPTSRPER